MQVERLVLKSKKSQYFLIMKMEIAWVTIFESDNERFVVGFYETERAAYMDGVATEFAYMSELYYLVRKYEKPSDYFMCITRLGTVDWTNKEEQEKWKKQHIEGREEFFDEDKEEGKPRMTVWMCKTPKGLVLKSEQEVVDKWEFEPVEWYEDE